MERVIGFDPQLLHDAILLAISVFFLFLLLSYLLFDPARQLLENRKNRIAEELADAALNQDEAKQLKAEYEGKLRQIDREAEAILAEARQKALANEAKIVDEAKAEARRIIERANEEAELEKKRVADEVKKEMITIAAAMAQKVVTAEINASVQEKLVDETLKEMGNTTWRS